MTLDETCDKLRAYLEEWYKERIEHYKGDAYKSTGLQKQELVEAYGCFMEANPDCQEHDLDIEYDFKVVKGSYQPPEEFCSNGCCGTWHGIAKASGIVVQKVDWERYKALAMPAKIKTYYPGMIVNSASLSPGSSNSSNAAQTTPEPCAPVQW